MPNTTLQTERDFFSEQLAELLQRHSGKIALIRGRELVGVFNTEQEALAEGTRRYGLSPFLIRRIQEQQPEASIPALTLGLIHANPPHAV